jgi:hypothetical protein
VDVLWVEHESVGAESHIVRVVPRTKIHEITGTKIFCVILGNITGNAFYYERLVETFPRRNYETQLSVARIRKISARIAHNRCGN